MNNKRPTILGQERLRKALSPEKAEKLMRENISSVEGKCSNCGAEFYLEDEDTRRETYECECGEVIEL